MTDDVAFAVGTATTVEIGTTRFGDVTTEGTIAGEELLSKAGAIGVIEGCTFGAGTGKI